MPSVLGLPTRNSNVTILITRISSNPNCRLIEFQANFAQARAVDYQSLEKNIQSSANVFPEFEGNPGDLCLVQVVGTWYRARIVTRNGSNYKVFLIDKGILHCTTTKLMAFAFQDEIKSPPDNLQKPIDECGIPLSPIKLVDIRNKSAWDEVRTYSDDPKVATDDNQAAISNPHMTETNIAYDAVMNYVVPPTLFFMKQLLMGSSESVLPFLVPVMQKLHDPNEQSDAIMAASKHCHVTVTVEEMVNCISFRMWRQINCCIIFGLLLGESLIKRKKEQTSGNTRIPEMRCMQAYSPLMMMTVFVICCQTYFSGFWSSVIAQLTPTQRNDWTHR
ncbi:tudor domain-containing 6 isoform X10 [Syngnathoides biaculeatus]|uniref:tudor domain-containing 6 isoform X10 n=1 Tax=Syngnathoides biaculeatus TaxID=300417 RepID=UPI002ADE4320|nr:tudor domain-containing 6 isoform X10 [Syngnathoides biaculeatus]